MSISSNAKSSAAPDPAQFVSPPRGVDIPQAISPENPRRPPDWRAQCIDLLLAYDPENRHPWPDPWRKLVWQARQINLKFLRANSILFHVLPNAILIAESMACGDTDTPAVGGSSALKSQGGTLRNIIESRILAGESLQVIMDELKPVPGPVIQSYVALYFDVADRLGDREFILQDVLQCNPAQGLDHAHPYQIWREVGYLAGAACLHQLTSFCKIEDNLSVTWTRDYFNTSLPVPGVVRDIMWQRYLPDYERTIEDLEKLYHGLHVAPDIKGSTSPSVPDITPGVNASPELDRTIVN